MKNDMQEPVSHMRHVRHSDRRVTTRLGPPPFYTREGKVMLERRSAIERRATWIREFSLDAADNGSGAMES